MERTIDTQAIEPLLRLTTHARADVAVAALRAASRLPLTEEAWRAVAREASAMIDGRVPEAVGQELFATAARIPAMSVRRRLRSLAEHAEGPHGEWAFRALLDAGDPHSLGRLIENLRKTPADEELWAHLARMPVEHLGLRPEELPVVFGEPGDAPFWRAIVLARLGEIDRLERFLKGEEDEPRLLWGNPWDAYARLATVRPLPPALRSVILERFGIGAPPDADAVRQAGLLVWALTGIADAEGYLVEPAGSPAVPPRSDEGEPRRARDVAADIAETATARQAAHLAIAQIGEAAPLDVALERLSGLPRGEVGRMLVPLLDAANRRMARLRDFSASNQVISIVQHLPAPDEIPVVELYRTWASAPFPAVDEEQLAWIVARAPLQDTIAGLAAYAEDRAPLDLLARVGDVVAGRAGSPFRGAGPGGAVPDEPRDLIEDEGWTSAAPPEAIEREAPPPADRPPIAIDRPLTRVRVGDKFMMRRGAPPVSALAVLSTEGPAALNVGAEADIRVRIERPDGARPLAHATTVNVRPEPISVIVFLSSEAVELTDSVLKMAPPPAVNRPSELTFAILAKHVGSATAIVHFQQGAAKLAMLSFPIDVVADGATLERARATGAAATRDAFDEGVVRMLIQPPSQAAPYYTYFVTSALLGLVNARFTSPPLEGDGDGAGRTRRFVEGLYRRIENALLERRSDADVLTRRLGQIGADMCQKLLPESLIRQLWASRDLISAVEVTPVEPYIPWELIRLEHPEHGVDVRHLAEYRLVRMLGGKEPARTLGRSEWRYVLGDYPNQLYADLPTERQFLTVDLPALGVPVVGIPARVEDVVAAISPAAFDVIHFACHGEASLDDIDASALIIADRLSAQQGTVGVKVFPEDLRVPLTPRRPLVFLSACQSARLAPSLTDFGGWPKVLADSQAGAVVGTAWAVYEKPAVAFAGAFYTSLLAGETLAEAAGAGRAAARQKGDASWLAYTVYGWSSARMAVV